MQERTYSRCSSERLLCDWRGATFIASSDDWLSGCRLSAGDRPEEARHGFAPVPVYTWRPDPASGRYVQVLLGMDWRVHRPDLSDIVFYPRLQFRRVFIGGPRWELAAPEPSVRVELVPDPFGTTEDQFRQARAAGGPACKWPRDMPRLSPEEGRGLLQELRSRQWHISEDPREPYYGGVLPLREIDRIPAVLHFE